VEYRRFEEIAWQYWDEIPEQYKDGVDGMVVSRDALPHPTLADIYTLGECLTESYPSDFGGPDTIRSILTLYHGSFDRLAELDPEFDWEDELWETLTHELQHHLESLASEDALVDMDYAVDENFKRMNAEPFDPFFYRSGERLADRVYRVERDVFLEQPYATGADFGDWIPFDWHGARYRVRRPAELGDVLFLLITGGVETGPGELELVLVRRPGFLASMTGLLRRQRLEVQHGEGRAEPGS
jgi:predicted Zn-dependent protease with MMP-like domain